MEVFDVEASKFRVGTREDVVDLDFEGFEVVLVPMLPGWII